MTGLVVAAAIVVVGLVSPPPPAPHARDWPPTSTLTPLASTVPAVSPPPVSAPPPEPSAPYRAVWNAVAACESGGDWTINTGNGYYGGLQFSAESWRWVGGTGLPHEHSREEQVRRAEILLARQGWGAWPACSRKLGLR